MSLRLQWPCQARAAPASAPPVSDNGLARLSSPRPPPGHTHSAVLGLEFKFSYINIDIDIKLIHDRLVQDCSIGEI